MKRKRPKLVAPKHLRTYIGNTRVKGEYIPGDEGKIVDGRAYTYHPTKGWRSRALKALA